LTDYYFNKFFKSINLGYSWDPGIWNHEIAVTNWMFSTVQIIKVKVYVVYSNAVLKY